MLSDGHENREEAQKGSGSIKWPNINGLPVNFGAGKLDAKKTADDHKRSVAVFVPSCVFCGHLL